MTIIKVEYDTEDPLCSIVNNLRLQAKKEVFDDIWNTWTKKYGNNHTSNEAIFDMHDMIRELEKHHLLTSKSEGT